MDETNRRSQEQLYGEPIAAIVHRIGRCLRMNQAQIARGVGLSAPMLSHLVAARRVKIGNPVALARLHDLNALALAVEAGQGPADVDAAVSSITEAEYDWGERTTRTLRSERASGVTDEQIVGQVQHVFRAVAGAEEWLQVVAEIQQRHPAVADMVRAYGLARTDDAVAHWQRHR